MNKTTLGLTADQLAHGTPSDKKIILKAFYKDDKATISPAKDMNGRYKGIVENIPEIKKLEMGYVPDKNSKVKIYDGIEIDLNDPTWAKDWEWMKHCVEIAPDFATGQATPGAYFYIYRPGFEAAKKVSTVEREVKLYNYILNDSPENLYNRAMMLGVDMSEEVISEVKDYLLNLVKTSPDKIEQVYESKTFSLELLLMHALKKNVIKKKNGVYLFGEVLLGVDKRAVVAFFANSKNAATTKAIEAMTYGTGTAKSDNPLENESVSSLDELDSEPVSSLDDFDSDGESLKSVAKDNENLSTVKNVARTRAAKKQTKK